MGTSKAHRQLARSMSATVPVIDAKEAALQLRLLLYVAKTTGRTDREWMEEAESLLAVLQEFVKGKHDEAKERNGRLDALTLVRGGEP